jgi:hypothetical protein
VSPYVGGRDGGEEKQVGLLAMQLARYSMRQEERRGPHAHGPDLLLAKHGPRSTHLCQSVSMSPYGTVVVIHPSAIYFTLDSPSSLMPYQGANKGDMCATT